MCDAIGQNFTVKQVKYGFRKEYTEFTKRLDPDLPYYYHTSSHTRYSEGFLPDFSQASKGRKRKSRRLPQREQPAAFTLRQGCVTGAMALNVAPHLVLKRQDT